MKTKNQLKKSASKIESVMGMEHKKNVSSLKGTLTRAASTKKQVALHLVSMEQHMPDGEKSLAKWADKILGIEIRKTVQHVYELAAILRGVIDKSLGLTEADYWSMGQNDLVQLSAFITKDEFKPRLNDAVEAVKSGEKVRAKLAAIRKEVNGTKAPPKPPKDDKPDSEKIEISILEPVVVRALKNEIDFADAKKLKAIEEVALKYLDYIDARIAENAKVAKSAKGKAAKSDKLQLVG